MIGIIAAVSSNGVIGIENSLPFNYPEDFKHFKKTTINSSILMGRKTFESIGQPLPKRRNIVISKTLSNIDGIEIADSLESAIAICAWSVNQKLAKSVQGIIPEQDSIPSENVWLIGGASIYEEGMRFADKIILTLTPDVELRWPAVRFPWINPKNFELKKIEPMENSINNLFIATYDRIVIS